MLGGGERNDFEYPVVIAENRDGRLSGTSSFGFDILPALKREDSHGTVPLGWDIVVYDVTCS